MRNPNPEYIVNLITNILGKRMIGHLTDQVLETVWQVYAVVGPTLVKALEGMSVETLARIIECGSWDVKIAGVSERKHNIALTPNNLQVLDPKNRVTPLFPHCPEGILSGLGGRKLLERAALVTLLTIIVDMINQEWYKADREIEAEEEEMCHRESERTRFRSATGMIAPF